MAPPPGWAPQTPPAGFPSSQSGMAPAYVPSQSGMNPAYTPASGVRPAYAPSGVAPMPQPGPNGTPPPTMVVPPPRDPLLGAQVGSYRILKMLGTGGMGSVYLGEHTGIGSKVAIKFLHEHLASNADLVQRFYAEARAVNVIGHANIVSIFDMNVLPPNRYYLVMEFLEGKSLESQVALGPMAMARAVPIISQVCDALDQAHQLGVVHRDLKPENVMLLKRGRQDDFVKILDFGIAKLHSSMPSRKTATGVIIGTPDYMAPEQAGAENVDGRTDQYSLGVIAYELATGRTPFAGMPLTAMLVAHLSQEPKAPHLVNPSVPLGVSAAIMKALAKRPDARFATCGAFADALEAALQAAASSPSIALQAQPVSSPSSAQRVTPASSDSAASRVTPSQAPPSSPSMAQGPAAAAPPRHTARFEVELKPAVGPTQKLQVQDVSRAGCFLCTTQPPPAVFSRVTLTLPNVGAVQGDVVRHVTGEQAQAWHMPQGFGVQFVGIKPEQREALDLLTKGLPVAPVEPKPPSSQADDHVAELTLADFRKRIQGDHYVVLSLGHDADVASVRARGRELSRLLTELKNRPLSPGQLKQVDATLQRVHQAAETLGHPGRRAEFDGMRANWKGVGLCLAAGLRVTELEEIRKRFLATNAGALARAQLHMLTAKGLEADGKYGDALRSVEHALDTDPLCLEYHHKRNALLKKSQH